MIEETTILFVRGFPSDLHREAKKAAIDDNVTLREWLAGLVAAELERRGADHGAA